MRQNPGSSCFPMSDTRVSTRASLELPALTVRRIAVALLLLASLVQGVAHAQDASVRAELSRPTITRDESVVLTITAIGIDGELDPASLDKDFDVVGRSSSRQITTIIDSNNRPRNTSVVTWALELLPRGQGVFTVPAVKVGDMETQLLTLTVNEVPQGAKRDVFIEASVDNTSPWVQSQVVMTLRFFLAIDIVDGGFGSPSADNLLVEQIGENTLQTETRDGRQYNVTESRFALFPQKSGTLTIDPVTLSVTVLAERDRVRSLFSPTRKLTRRSDPITLNVKARPSTGAAWWLPAQQLTLDSQWQGDPASAQVDQPLTRTLVMRAQGVLESQLPRISIPAIDGLSLYAEDPQVAMGADASGLVSEQRTNWALIPQRSGTLTLPAISVEWFNTLTGQTEVTELPAETIEVSPSASSRASTDDANGTGALLSSGITNEYDSTTATTSLSESQGVDASQALTSDSNGTQIVDLADGTDIDLALNAGPDTLQRIGALESSVSRWRLAALALIVLWLISVVFWLIRQRQQASGNAFNPFQSSAKQARSVVTDGKHHVTGRLDALQRQLMPLSQVDQACKQGDLLLIKSALLDWAARQWSVNSPSTLDDLQQRLPEGTARELIGQLQVALYGKANTGQAMPLLKDSLAGLPDALKQALQRAGAVPASEDAANEERLAVKVGRSLPPL